MVEILQLGDVTWSVSVLQDGKGELCKAALHLRPLQASQQCPTLFEFILSRWINNENQLLLWTTVVDQGAICFKISNLIQMQLEHLICQRTWRGARGEGFGG